MDMGTKRMNMHIHATSEWPGGDAGIHLLDPDDTELEQGIRDALDKGHEDVHVYQDAESFLRGLKPARMVVSFDVDPGEPDVYCHGCSEAGGAERAIYHAPPACGVTDK